MPKVYCRDCKYSLWDSNICRHGVTYNKYIDKKESYRQKDRFNENGECEEYKRKRWKFWV